MRDLNILLSEGFIPVVAFHAQLAVELKLIISFIIHSSIHSIESTLLSKCSFLLRSLSIDNTVSSETIAVRLHDNIDERAHYHYQLLPPFFKDVDVSS